MKKIFFLLMLLLASCAPATVDPNKTRSLPTADWSAYQPYIESFEFSKKCPHMCWLGINPGVTTGQEAQAILEASDQIQEITQSTETGILVKWYTEPTKKLHTTVYLFMENGVIKTLSFQELPPFTLQNFIGLVGEPDGVNIDMNVYGDVMEMPYSVYFYEEEIVIGAQAADSGPHANDALINMTLNIPYKREIFRQWVGYGHLKEYFAGKEFHQHDEQP